MRFPSLSSEYLRKTLQPVLTEIVDTCAVSGKHADDLPEPPLLLTAFERLFDVLARTETGRPETGAGNELKARQARNLSSLRPQAVTELGEYAFVLLHELNRWVDHLHLRVHEAMPMELAAAVALWISRNGGNLLTLEPIADALAYFANNTSDTNRLEEIYVAYDEVIAAVTPGIRRDLEKINPGRPWRVLNLNRAIVATRCHKTDLMESSFESLVANFPEDAAQFFHEGMRQMDALDYPGSVRVLMERYHSRYAVKHSIH